MDLIRALPKANVATLVISLICIVILFGTKEYLSPYVKKWCKFPIPIELIVVRFAASFILESTLFCIVFQLISATLASSYGDFSHRFNVTIVDNIPTG